MDRCVVVLAVALTIGNSVPAFARDAAAEIGTVAWYNQAKGIGMITNASSGNVFVTAAALVPGTVLCQGLSVHFDVITGPNGNRAENVSALAGCSPSADTPTPPTQAPQDAEPPSATAQPEATEPESSGGGGGRRRAGADHR